MAEGRSVKSPGIAPRETEDLVIGPPDRRWSGFFNLDCYPVSHRILTEPGSKFTDTKTYELFERGDSVGVLLYNRDRHAVVVVRQFRLPTVDLVDEPSDVSRPGVPSHRNGWIIETVAGMIGSTEGPDGRSIDELAAETAIRETKEETGYIIERPELVATFFSSPGGTSERIFLYFAFVSDAKREGLGGGKIDPKTGKNTENIEVLTIGIEDFSALLKKRELVDPKLLIAAYYLQARIGLRIETDQRLVKQQHPHCYGWDRDPFKADKKRRIEISIKTGDILEIDDVDIWLNPENRYMMMARVIDDSLSAAIRWGGAEKFSNDLVAVDTIGNALRSKLGERSEVKDHEIVETTPGKLAGSRRNRVRRLLHLPIGEATRSSRKSGLGLKVDCSKIATTFREAFEHAHNANKSSGRWLLNRLSGGRLGKPCRSVLVPLVTTGQGKGHLTADEVVPEILKGLDEFLENHRGVTDINRIFFLARYKRDIDAIEAAFEDARDAGTFFDYLSPPDA